jgi:hypothetical protein
MVWCSHSTGTRAAAKMVCTAVEISGPMPSPGNSVARNSFGFTAAAAAAARAPASGDVLTARTWARTPAKRRHERMGRNVQNVINFVDR